MCGRGAMRHSRPPVFMGRRDERDDDGKRSGSEHLVPPFVIVGTSPTMTAGVEAQAFSTNPSSTFLSPALSKLTVSLLPSTAATFP